MLTWNPQGLPFRKMVL